MQFITPDSEELTYLRPDPLLVEQELDVRPDVAEAIERATGLRAGRVYWRSEHDHLYALELGDLGHGRPSTATVYGHWERYEPRPPEHEIDADLLAFSLWVAEVSGSINPSDVSRMVQFARIRTSWPEGSVLRTPADRFSELPGYPYEPRYVDVEGLRMAYVEHGAGDPILCLHGEPTWGYLYRRMIPALAGSGRVIVPDLIGFGRSDKPMADNSYSYRSHARWLRRFVEALDLQRITLVCQDWGGAARTPPPRPCTRAVRAAGGDEHRHSDRRGLRPGFRSVAHPRPATARTGSAGDDAPRCSRPDAYRHRGCRLRRPVSVRRVSDRRPGLSPPRADPSRSPRRIRQPLGGRGAPHA